MKEMVKVSRMRMQEPISVSHGIISRCLLAAKEQLVNLLVRGVFVRDRQAERIREKYSVVIFVGRESLLN